MTGVLHIRIGDLEAYIRVLVLGSRVKYWRTWVPTLSPGTLKASVPGAW